jgi:hypothetical protein
MNTTYVDFDHVFRLAEKNYVRLGVQFMNQSGNGANLVTGGRDFNTNYWGDYVELRLLSWLVPYAMAGKTSDGEDIRSPFAIGPSFLVQRIGENSKAGDHAFRLKEESDIKRCLDSIQVNIGGIAVIIVIIGDSNV